MCQAKSFIPAEIWRLGDRTTNLIEALHADANREGIACSLVGGYLKGLRFDLAKEKVAQVCFSVCSFVLGRGRDLIMALGTH